MNSPIVSNAEAKFTKGEKCLFVHLVITFILILLTILTYFVHLYQVNHVGSSVFSARLLKTHSQESKTKVPEYLPLGVLYLNNTPNQVICNTIHIHERWSVTPAHCTTIRSDLHMASFIFNWRIKYRTVNYSVIVTEIKRSVIHPHFNRDDFANNIGLLEHTKSLPMHQYYIFANRKTNNGLLTSNNYNRKILAEWRPIIATSTDGTTNYNRVHFVRSMEKSKCYGYLAYILDLRSYEFCVTVQRGTNTSFDHGAAFFEGYNISGFFSWGDKQGKSLPLVILYLVNFKEWLHNTMYNKIFN